MNPDRNPQPLRVERVEWIPSSPDEIEVRVYGTWHGSTVPPEVSLVIGNDVVGPLGDPPAPGLAPAWTSAYLVPVEERAALEEGRAALAGPDFALPLPAAVPGAMDGPAGTVVDPAVLAERRARRAEMAEETAAERASSAEQTVATLRAQLEHLEERAARAGADRDALAARVADAERRLRLAGQREEAERRRRAELDDEVATVRRSVETEVEDLRARLSGAEELADALERELDRARRRTEDANRIAEAERAARVAAEEEAKRAVAEADSLRAETGPLRTRAAEADALRAEAESLRRTAAEVESLRAEADALRAEAEALRSRAAEVEAGAAASIGLDDAEALRTEAESLRARAAEADALRDEVEALRARAAEADVLRAEAEALRTEAESLRLRAAEAGASSAELESLRLRAGEAEAAGAELESLRLRAGEAGALRAEAEALREEASELRARAARAESFRAEAAALRAESEGLRARAATAESLRARITELERRLVAQPVAAETESLRARVAELDRRLAAERAARAAAEEQLAARPERAPSERERALIAQIATLEEELARRAAIQERVQESIALIRIELGQVRAQVDETQPARAAESAAVAGLRAELVELEQRVQELEASLRARGAELEAAREDLGRARGETAAARAEADRFRQAAAGAERSAADARQLARELAERLAAEEATRSAVEERLARGGGRPDDPPATGDPALDTLITGLRAQVAAAREQLARWEDPAAPAAAEPPSPAPADAPSPGPGGPSAGVPAPGPSAERPSPAGAAPSGEPDAHDFPSLDEPLPPKPDRPASKSGAPPPPAPDQPASPPGAAERGGSGPEHAESAEAEARRRLQSIAAELRSAVPEEPAAGAPDVVGDLQRAAERLRTAAERELERLERPGDEGSGAGAAPALRSGAITPRPAAAVEPLGPRRVALGAHEAPWLRVALERLAEREPETAAKLLAALLPVQALTGHAIAYELTAPAAGTLRVALAGGTARVEPREAPGSPAEVDAIVEGPLAALAPLAAGGAGWRLKDVRVHGSRRKLRRLTRARRRPVTLIDLGRAGSPVHPGLLLSALATAVEPAWTAGHRFAIAYEIGGDGTFEVRVEDGIPLRVLPTTSEAVLARRGELVGTVVVGAAAFMALVAGHAPPPGEQPHVIGDRRPVDLLHTWFDTARGVRAN